MGNIVYFQLLICEDLLFFFILYHCKMNIFGFGAIGLTKQAFMWHQLELWDFVMGNFYYLMTFYRQNE